MQRVTRIKSSVTNPKDIRKRQLSSRVKSSKKTGGVKEALAVHVSNKSHHETKSTLSTISLDALGHILGFIRAKSLCELMMCGDRQLMTRIRCATKTIDATFPNPLRGCDDDDFDKASRFKFRPLGRFLSSSWFSSSLAELTLVFGENYYCNHRFLFADLDCTGTKFEQVSLPFYSLKRLVIDEQTLYTRLGCWVDSHCPALESLLIYDAKYHAFPINHVIDLQDESGMLQRALVMPQLPPSITSLRWKVQRSRSKASVGLVSLPLALDLAVLGRLKSLVDLCITSRRHHVLFIDEAESSRALPNTLTNLSLRVHDHVDYKRLFSGLASLSRLSIIASQGVVDWNDLPLHQLTKFRMSSFTGHIFDISPPPPSHFNPHLMTKLVMDFIPRGNVYEFTRVDYLRALPLLTRIRSDGGILVPSSSSSSPNHPSHKFRLDPSGMIIAPAVADTGSEIDLRPTELKELRFFHYGRNSTDMFELWNASLLPHSLTLLDIGIDIPPKECINNCLSFDGAPPTLTTLTVTFYKSVYRCVHVSDLPPSLVKLKLDYPTSIASRAPLRRLEDFELMCNSRDFAGWAVVDESATKHEMSSLREVTPNLISFRLHLNSQHVTESRKTCSSGLTRLCGSLPPSLGLLQAQIPQVNRKSDLLFHQSLRCEELCHLHTLKILFRSQYGAGNERCRLVGPGAIKRLDNPDKLCVPVPTTVRILCVSSLSDISSSALLSSRVCHVAGSGSLKKGKGDDHIFRCGLTCSHTLHDIQ